MKKILYAVILVLFIYGCSTPKSTSKPKSQNRSIPSYVIITNPYSFPVHIEISTKTSNWQAETLSSYDKAEFPAAHLFVRICSEKTDCNTYKLVRGGNYFVQYDDKGKWFIGSADKE